MVVRAMKYAKEANESGDTSHIPALDKLVKAGIEAWNFDQDPWKGEHRLPTFPKNTTLPWGKCDKTAMWTRNFFGEAIMNDLFAYAKVQLRTNQILLQKHQAAKPLLFYILDPTCQEYLSRSSDLKIERGLIEMTKLLVQEGEDLDQRWRGETMWQKTLHYISESTIISRERSRQGTSLEAEKDLLDVADILSYFLKHGADDIYVPLGEGQHGRKPADDERQARDARAIKRIVLVYNQYKYLRLGVEALRQALDRHRARVSQPEAVVRVKRMNEKSVSHESRKRFRGSGSGFY